MSKKFDGEYMAEKKRTLYDRGELLFPKESDLKARTANMAKFLGVSFNAYVMSALEAKLAADEAVRDRCDERFVLCKDELISAAKRANRKPGFVFENRPDDETETVIGSFASLEEAKKYAEDNGMCSSSVEPVGKRYDLVKEYAIRREYADKVSGQAIINFGYVWFSAF